LNPNESEIFSINDRQDESEIGNSDQPQMMNIDDRDKAGDPDSNPEVNDSDFSMES